jgi:FAD/FMN-containing dehydrogenase
MVTALFKQPLHQMPAGAFAFSIRLQRRASAKNAPDHLSMLAANEALVRTYLPQGGKMYPPFAPPVTEREWRLNYGRVWNRFAEAKKRYDPNNILTPGARVFEDCKALARSNERCS